MLYSEGFTMKSKNNLVDWLANQAIVRELGLEPIKINNVIEEVKGLKFLLTSLVMEFLGM